MRDRLDPGPWGPGVARQSSLHSSLEPLSLQPPCRRRFTLTSSWSTRLPNPTRWTPPRAASPDRPLIIGQSSSHSFTKRTKLHSKHVANPHPLFHNPVNQEGRRLIARIPSLICHLHQRRISVPNTPLGSLCHIPSASDVLIPEQRCLPRRSNPGRRPTVNITAVSSPLSLCPTRPQHWQHSQLAWSRLADTAARRIRTAPPWPPLAFSSAQWLTRKQSQLTLTMQQ